MTTIDALNQLRHGGSIDCVTPEGRRFQIQSKASYGIAWYRVRPVMRGCLNRYSRLSDQQMTDWLNSVNIEEPPCND